MITADGLLRRLSRANRMQLLAVAVVAAIGASAAHAASISIGSAQGEPGSTLSFDVTLHAAGVSIATNDIIFDGVNTPIQSVMRCSNNIMQSCTQDGDCPSSAHCVAVPDCSLGPNIVPSADPAVLRPFRLQAGGCGEVGCTTLRATVFEQIPTTIPDGSVLYRCKVAVPPTAMTGNYPLVVSAVQLVVQREPGESTIIAGTFGTSGAIVVGQPTLPVAAIRLGTVMGDSELTATLDTTGLVAATQNDIEYSVNAPIGATEAGAPDCSVNPALGKADTSFAFLPGGCIPRMDEGATGDCHSVRAVVISNSNIDPIPDGSMLYSCRVRSFMAAYSAYPLICSGASASDPNGNDVSVRCTNGIVFVPTPSPTATPTSTATVTGTVTQTATATATATETATPTPIHCVGDCNADGLVTVDELLNGVSIAVTAEPLDRCPQLDFDRNGAVTVNELVKAVNNALKGCNDE